MIIGAVSKDPATHTLMRSDFVSLDRDLSVREAIQKLKDIASYKKLEGIGYIYVTDREKRLAGVLEMRDLVLEASDRKLFEIAKNGVVTIDISMSLEEVIEKFRDHPFLSLPVTDREGRLIGVVDSKDLIEEVQAKRGHELYQILGVRPEEIAHRSIREIILLRAPWIFLTILSGLLAAFILGNFFIGIESILSVVVFIPIVLGLSGSMCRQGAAIVARTLEGSGPSFREIGKLAWKESSVAFLAGLISFVSISLLALWLKKSLLIAFSVSLGIALAVTASGWLGILLPLIFFWLRMKAKLATGPMVVVVADLFALWVYLQISYFFLSRYFEVS